ncbi:hypothetical protein OIU76_018173 [Salix suchowensis]|nr:hypothetical protein OIU76_018173 [Salix suchowensis]
MDQFRDSMLEDPDPGPNYAKLMEEYDSKIEAKIPTEIIIIEEPDKQMQAKARDTQMQKLKGDLEVVQRAYYYFNIFKGLIVDIIFSFKDRNESRKFFHSIDAEDALKVIEVELNFIYEVLFTKAVVVHSVVGYVFRLLSFILVVVALALFRFNVKKETFDPLDVKLTYVLLWGSVSLDTVALVRAVLSDWTVANLDKPEKLPDSCGRSCAAFFSAWKEPLFNVKRAIFKFIGIRSWCESVKGYNLIRYCVNRPKSRIGICRDKVLGCVGLRDFVDGIFQVSNKRFTQELWKVIFDELKKKSDSADDPEDAKRICSARGNLALQDYDGDKNLKDKLMPYVVDVTYDESLLLWHIATELLYSEDGNPDQRSDDKSFCKLLSECICNSYDDTDQKYNEKKLSKLLSDYMMYLLIMQPAMMAAVAGIGKIRFRDTCAEAGRFLKRRDLGSNKELGACINILGVNTKDLKLETESEVSSIYLIMQKPNEYWWTAMSDKHGMSEM